jgi:hypothetical protein
MFFGKPISVRKSLSCITSEVRAWSERSGRIRIDRVNWKAIFEVQAPIRSSRSRVPRREERRNEWTREAKGIERGALICRRFEGKRGNDSPLAVWSKGCKLAQSRMAIPRYVEEFSVIS